MQTLQDSHHNQSVNKGHQGPTIFPKISKDQILVDGPLGGEPQNYDQIVSSYPPPDTDSLQIKSEHPISQNTKIANSSLASKNLDIPLNETLNDKFGSDHLLLKMRQDTNNLSSKTKNSHFKHEEFTLRSDHDDNDSVPRGMNANMDTYSVGKSTTNQDGLFQERLDITNFEQIKEFQSRQPLKVIIDDDRQVKLKEKSRDSAQDATDTTTTGKTFAQRKQSIDDHFKTQQVTADTKNLGEQNFSSAVAAVESKKLNIPDLLSTKERETLYAPPLDVYKPRVNVNHDTVSYGLNMYFKKPHKFSLDPEQAGGPLAQNQAFLSQPWGANGCPPTKQQNLTDYVQEHLRDVVFCRYGMEYLKSFPRNDEVQIGSYKINLDYLIFHKQKQIQNNESNKTLLEMNFLKTKGIAQMNKLQNMQNAKMISTMKPGQTQIVQQATNPNKFINPFYKTLNEETVHTTLEFDSVFESGNLAIAIKKSETEYNCLAQNDINTNGHTQWFYFKVKSNFKKSTAVKINLINLYKSKSLFQYGMQVLQLDVSKSDQNQESESTQHTDGDDKQKEEGQKKKEPKLPKWQRCPGETFYVQNEFTNESSPNGLFQVSFTYEFQAGKKEIYFAHSLPYTYSMLNEFLSKQKVKRQTLCHSLAGNKVEYIVVTNKPKPKTQEPEEGKTDQASTVKQEQDSTKVNTAKKKKTLDGQMKKAKMPPKVVNQPDKPIQKQVIMLTSRVHPGETGASWMIHGLIDTLLNPKNEEERVLVNNLKDHFEFYIIPMLNVDGVINGNYRCSLAACDLNRKYQKPSKALHPSIYYTKKLCDTLLQQENKQFFLYLDFHGHSVKKNIFQYGNKIENLIPSKVKPPHTLPPSVFPMILSKHLDYFNFQDCTYSMPKSKDSTSRITMFHKLRTPFVYTIESSFAGASRGALAGQHFSQRDLQDVGKHILMTIWEVKKLLLNKNLMKQVSEEAKATAKTSNDDEADSEETDSSEEEGELQASETAKKAIEVIQDEKSPDTRVKQVRTDGINESPDLSPLTERKVTEFPLQPAKPIITLQMIKGTDEKKVPLEQKQVLKAKSRTEGHSRLQQQCQNDQKQVLKKSEDDNIISNKGLQYESQKQLRQMQKANLITTPEQYEPLPLPPESNPINVQQIYDHFIKNQNQYPQEMGQFHKFLRVANDVAINGKIPQGAMTMTVKPGIYNQKKQVNGAKKGSFQEIFTELKNGGQGNLQQLNNGIEKIMVSKRDSQVIQKDTVEQISDNLVGQPNKNKHLQQFLQNTIKNQKRDTDNLDALYRFQKQAQQLLKGKQFSNERLQRFNDEIKQYQQEKQQNFEMSQSQKQQYQQYIIDKRNQMVADQQSEGTVSVQNKNMKGSKLSSKVNPNLQMLQKISDRNSLPAAFPNKARNLRDQKLVNQSFFIDNNTQRQSTDAQNLTKGNQNKHRRYSSTHEKESDIIQQYVTNMPFSSSQIQQNLHEQEALQYFTQNQKSNYKVHYEEQHDLVPPVTSGKKPPLSQPQQHMHSLQSEYKMTKNNTLIQQHTQNSRHKQKRSQNPTKNEVFDLNSPRHRSQRNSLEFTSGNRLQEQAFQQKYSTQNRKNIHKNIAADYLPQQFQDFNGNGIGLDSPDIIAGQQQLKGRMGLGPNQFSFADQADAFSIGSNSSPIRPQEASNRHFKNNQYNNSEANTTKQKGRSGFFQMDTEEMKGPKKLLNATQTQNKFKIQISSQKQNSDNYSKPSSRNNSQMEKQRIKTLDFPQINHKNTAAYNKSQMFINSMRNQIIQEEPNDHQVHSATVKFETTSPSKMPRIYESTHLESYQNDDSSYHYTVQQKRGGNSKINMMNSNQSKSKAMKQSLASNLQIVSRNSGHPHHHQSSIKVEQHNVLDRPEIQGQSSHPVKIMKNTKSHVVGNIHQVQMPSKLQPIQNNKTNKRQRDCQSSQGLEQPSVKVPISIKGRDELSASMPQGRVEPAIPNQTQTMITSRNIRGRSHRGDQF